MENKQNIIYFDNGATSWPKPPEMAEAMMHFINDIGASPGRSGHTLAVEAGHIVFSCRENLCKLFNIKNPQQIAFTKNITEALNMVFFTILEKGDHVVTTSMEHNSVMRPLRYLESQGVIELSVVQADKEGVCAVDDFPAAMKKNTRMVVVSHSSNVTGTLQDVSAISKACKAKKEDILFVIDSAQSAGAVSIDVEAMGIDILCFTGHKSLLGPTGTGGVYLTPAVTPRPFMHGGSGSKSDMEVHPLFMPDVWEAGTINIMGLAGLNASLEYLLKTGVENIRAHEIALTQQFIDGIKDHPMVKLYGPLDATKKTPVTSLNIEGIVCSTVGTELNDACGIMVRTGLHCAPGSHKTIGTFPTGSVRFAFGGFTKPEEIEVGVKAIRALADYEATQKEV